MFRRKSFPGPSRNPLKHVLQHMHIYPLSNSQCFAELCQKLLSQGKTLTFVCVIGNVLPLTKQKGIFPDTLTIQDWSHQLDLTSFCRGCRKKMTFSAANYSKPNKTKTPAQPNTRTKQHSFERRCVEPGSGITPAMVPPHTSPKDCAISILPSTKKAGYNKLFWSSLQDLDLRFGPF